MKKRTSRMVALLMMFVLILTAGCGNQKSTNETKEKGTVADTSTKMGPEAKKTVRMVRTYSPAIDRFPEGENINSNPVIEYHREQSGIDLQVETLPSENANQQIALILSGGDVPDIIQINSKELFYKYAAQGAFMPVGDLLDTLAPHYLEVTDPALFEYVMYDGQEYAIPYFKGDYSQTHGLYARTDVLEEVGIDKGVKDLDQFREDLRLIKDKTGLIPLSVSAYDFSSFFSSLGYLQGSFGLGTNTKDIDGKLEFSWIQPQYKEFLAYVKSLYDEGLLDNEFAVNQDKQTQEKMVGGTAVMSFINWWTAKTIDSSLQEKVGSNVVEYLPLPTGKNGESGVKAPNLINSYFCIPNGAKNPEAAIKFLEYMASDDALFIQNYGLENIYYTKEGDKIVSTAEQSAAADFLTVYQMVDNRDNFLLRQEKKGFTPYYSQIVDYNKIEEPTALMPSSDKYDAKYSELTTFVVENSIKFIMGARDLEEFDDYVAEFNQRGGEEAIKIANEWYQNH